MLGRWKAAAAVSVVLLAPVVAGAALADPSPTSPSSSAPGQDGSVPPGQARACGTPASWQATCGAIQLVSPATDWQPGANGQGHSASTSATGTTGSATVPAPPGSGYYPGDLQSAYGLAGAIGAFQAGASAPTIAIVDAYDDPTAISDVTAYRASLNNATDPNTGLPDGSVPPVCGGGVTTPCVMIQKLEPEGVPQGNSGWAEEISLDLDMASAICPNCNIDLVESADNSFANLANAVTYAKGLSPAPAAVTNSYGGSEFSGETSYNSIYSSDATTAVTASTGDSGYGVEFPAADPSDTAVGGTSLTFSGFGATLGWSPQTVWSGAGSGCSSQEAQPAWQNIAGVYKLSADCSSGRQVADVSAVADPNTGVAVYDTDGLGGWAVFGGTSASAQIIGAMYGLAAGGGTIHSASSSLYGPTGPVAGLVPVTSGHNGRCGNYLCNASDSLSSGYNGPAGLGTPSGVGAFGGGGGQTTGSLGFSPSSESGTAGSYLGPITVTATTAPNSPLTVNLSTTSSGGAFYATSGGTTPITSVSISSGTSSNSFFYRDTKAGAPTVRASAAGWGSGTLPTTVTANTATTVSVTPSPVTVPANGTQGFSASASDTYGNPVPGASFKWTTSAPGSVNPGPSTSTTFTAGSTGGSGSVTATLTTNSAVSGSASVTVTTVQSMTVTVKSGTFTSKHNSFQGPLTVTATSPGGAVSGASVTLRVYKGSTCSGTAVATGSGSTNGSGQYSYNFSTRTAGSYCAAATVTKSGFSTGNGSATFTA